MDQMSSNDRNRVSQAQCAPPQPGTNWRLRFWLVFSGQGVSLLGSALTQFVLLWWITDTTGSMSALATAGMAALLPQALLAPLGGTLADRYSRRVIMIVADLVSALCMVVLITLFHTGSINLHHVYLMMAIRSAMQAFQAPASASSVAMLVPRFFLTRAAGLNQSVQSMTVVAAAPIGAFALGLMPIGWALAIDVVTAVLGIVPLLLFKVPQPERVSVQKRSFFKSLSSEFAEGVSLIWSSAGLRRLYALVAGVVLVVMPSFTLVPLLVKNHFGGGVQQVALMEGLSGVGMVFGGLLVAAMVPRRHILWVLWGFAASCLSLALTALVPQTMFVFAVGWWFISGVTFVFANAPLTALLQTTIPLQLQGRALSLLNAMMGMAAPIGLLVVAPLGDVVPVDTLFVVIGILGALVSLSGFLSPSLMELRATEEGGLG